MMRWYLQCLENLRHYFIKEEVMEKERFHQPWHGLLLDLQLCIYSIFADCY